MRLLHQWGEGVLGAGCAARNLHRASPVVFMEKWDNTATSHADYNKYKYNYNYNYNKYNHRDNNHNRNTTPRSKRFTCGGRPGRDN